MEEFRNNFGLAALALLLGCSFASYKANAEDKDNKDNKDRARLVQSLSVFDANGKRVGNVLGFFGANAIIAFRVDGEVVILGLNHAIFESVNQFAERRSDLYFESANCTGTPFSPAGSPNPALAPFHILDGTKLYAFDGPPRTIIVRSLGSTSFPNSCQALTSFQMGHGI